MRQKLFMRQTKNKSKLDLLNEAPVKTGRLVGLSSKTVLAYSLLLHPFHRQAQPTLIINRRQLHFHLLPHRKHICHVRNPFI